MRANMTAARARLPPSVGVRLAGEALVIPLEFDARFVLVLVQLRGPCHIIDGVWVHVNSVVRPLCVRATTCLPLRVLDHIIGSACNMCRLACVEVLVLGARLRARNASSYRNEAFVASEEAGSRCAPGTRCPSLQDR